MPDATEVKKGRIGDVSRGDFLDRYLAGVLKCPVTVVSRHGNIVFVTAGHIPVDDLPPPPTNMDIDAWSGWVFEAATGVELDSMIGDGNGVVSFAIRSTSPAPS